MWSILTSIINVIVGFFSIKRHKQTVEQENTELKVKAEKLNTQSVKAYHDEKDKIVQAQIDLAESNHVADKEIKELRKTGKLRIEL